MINKLRWVEVSLATAAYLFCFALARLLTSTSGSPVCMWRDGASITAERTVAVPGPIESRQPKGCRLWNGSLNF
jgi:hypothetical protein